MSADSESNPVISRLTPFAQALAAIDTVKPAGAHSLAPASGQVLAADVVIAAAHPPRWTALQDGWAVTTEETADASAYAPAPLGKLPQRIGTGEAMPAGTDAVAPLDAIAVRGERAEALALVTPGEGVLATGHDVPPGATLYRAGRRLSRADVALLGITGTTAISVRAPRIRIVSARQQDRILQAAEALIVSEMRKAGAVALTGDGRLHEAIGDSDALIVLGGTGSGEQDRSAQWLSRAGKLAFHGVGFTPGETAAFGFVDGKPTLLIPGRLDAAIAVWLTLGRRLLGRLAAAGEETVEASATLTRKVASTVGLVELVPVNRSGERAEPLAIKFLPFSALARANGWFLVPADSEGYPAGATVSVRSWP